MPHVHVQVGDFEQVRRRLEALRPHRDIGAAPLGLGGRGGRERAVDDAPAGASLAELDDACDVRSRDLTGVELQEQGADALGVAVQRSAACTPTAASQATNGMATVM